MSDQVQDNVTDSSGKDNFANPTLIPVAARKGSGLRYDGFETSFDEITATPTRYNKVTHAVESTPQRKGRESPGFVPMRNSAFDSPSFKLHSANKKMPVNAPGGSQKSFSITPGPKTLFLQGKEKAENVPNSPAGFQLFGDTGSDRQLNYSNIKNNGSRTPQSPDLLNMVSKIVNSFTPGEERSSNISTNLFADESLSNPDDLQQWTSGLNRSLGLYSINENETLKQSSEGILGQPWSRSNLEESWIQDSSMTSKDSNAANRTMEIFGPTRSLDRESIKLADFPPLTQSLDSFGAMQGNVEYFSGNDKVLSMRYNEANKDYPERRKYNEYLPPRSSTDSLRSTSIFNPAGAKDNNDGGFRPKHSLEYNYSLPNSMTNKMNQRTQRSRNSNDRSGSNVLTSSMESDGNFSRRSLNLDLRVSNESNKATSKQEFVESPRSKAAFKDFSAQFKLKCKISAEEAETFAKSFVETMPEHARWRVYVELAEFAKKNNDSDKARGFYIKACVLEKKASTTWLEWSKMEEENGRLVEALNVLKVGLMICKFNDALLPRSIKLHERLHLFEEIRQYLSSLSHEPLDKAWKSILEGCLFEARIGNVEVARKIFKYLMRYVPWYGPIYFEAFRLEEREGQDDAALEIIRVGLSELPRYGPLWFGLMRIMERKDIKSERRFWQLGFPPELRNLTAECNEAVKSISKELTWRVHYERFQAEERAAEIAALGMFQQYCDAGCSSGNKESKTSNTLLQECRSKMLARCRKSLTQSLLLCPSNLRWKLFLVGVRLEVGIGKIETARLLICRALAEVPNKAKASVYIECSRLEEYIGNVEVARSILKKAKDELQDDWRLCLEATLLETRQGRMEDAIELAREAVNIHPGTGRIWALFIQLHHRYEGNINFVLDLANCTSIDLQQSFADFNVNASLIDKKSWAPKDIITRRAITEVPKSGEVWCEHGRCCLNPLLLKDFDLAKAQQSFAFAILFTPQYGDTFVEYLRLELLCCILLHTICTEVLHLSYDEFVQCFVAKDQESDIFMASAQRLQSKHSQSSRASPDEESQEIIDREKRIKRRQSIIALYRLRYDFKSKLKASSKTYQFPQLTRR